MPNWPISANPLFFNLALSRLSMAIAISIFPISLILNLLIFAVAVVQGQQAYVNNKQLDCYNNYSQTYGYVCTGPLRQCQSYLTFRSDPPYTSPPDIAYLLTSQAPRIAAVNNITDADSIPTHTQILVPINCSCSGDFYQHNTSYILKYSSETYFSVANNTFQGLTTCQALIAQNPYDSRNLLVGMKLVVPLRCACPTANQTARGVKYLVNYMVNWDDSISSIAQLFGVDERSVLDANELNSDSIIFPFTTILIPLTTEPTKIQPAVSPPAASSPPQTPILPVQNSNSSKKWVFVGVGIGAAFLLLALSGFLFWFCRHRSKESGKGKPVSGSEAKTLSDSAGYAPPPESKSWSVSVSTDGVRHAIESLTVYKFEDLQKATEFFSEANRIKSSVYLGSFRGDNAAVKIMKGDVSSEINILKQINHINIIRLSGFCVHDGNTYLVYEYASNGSLGDWLHSKKFQSSFSLAWKQRAQIAYDVADALNYLHNYSNPPYIHKNLKTSNILLDSNFRAKIGNFGLARTVEDNEEGGLQLTKHVVGTQGYMAPEYIENGVITSKLDVFAFGVVILELLSGKEAAAGAGEKNGGEELLSASINGVLEGDNVREKLRGFIDPSLRHEYPLDLAFSMAQLAKTCVAHDLNSRPAMQEVFMTASMILSSSLDWDPSDELDRSKSLSESR